MALGLSKRVGLISGLFDELKSVNFDTTSWYRESSSNKYGFLLGFCEKNIGLEAKQG